MPKSFSYHVYHFTRILFQHLKHSTLNTDVQKDSRKNKKICLSTVFSTFFPFQLHIAQPIKQYLPSSEILFTVSKFSPHTIVDELFGVYLQKITIPTFPPTQ